MLRKLLFRMPANDYKNVRFAYFITNMVQNNQLDKHTKDSQPGSDGGLLAYVTDTHKNCCIVSN